LPPTRQQALLLAAAGSLAALLMIEIIVRFAAPMPDGGGDSENERYSIPDPLLGRIPRPGVSVHDPDHGVTITIGDHGTRSNGGTPPKAAHPITLAVGDSFTFGDQVTDDASWPAELEELLGERVINAGIPGFGLDQTVLRAEQLATIYSPDTIIVSFIPHDIARCEMSHFAGNAKPYFEIDASGLRLQPPQEPSPPYLARLERALAKSVALRHAFPKLLDSNHHEEVIVHHRGRDVACRLMEQLAKLAGRPRPRVVVLAQPQQPSPSVEDVEVKNEALACAAKNDLPVLDLFPVIEALPPEQRAALFERHMTAAGNRLVATELARFLGDGGSLPSPSSTSD